jgi:RNA polymerase sigma-70 factor (ECF subfamily)
MPPSNLLETYLEKRTSLVRFFAARLKSVGAAEDLVQELYLKLASLDPAEAIENPSAFLYRAAQNLLLDHQRQERRTSLRDGAWQEATELRAGEPAGEDALAARRRLARLAAIVEAMPTKMGQAFRLHKLDGLSHAETARLMNVSVSAVEKHISAALKLILRKLE